MLSYISTFYVFQIRVSVHCLNIDLIFQMMHEGCGPMLLLQWVVTNGLIYIFDILPPAIGCDYRDPDTMDWSVLIRVERTLLTDRCTAAPPWHSNIDIVVSLVTRVTRQCRVMLTPVTVIKINIRSEWVTNSCRDSRQSSQTAGARGAVRHAISGSGSQEILHWPLFQGE